jgi:hypothetical protein
MICKFVPEDPDVGLDPDESYFPVLFAVVV